MDIRTYAGFYDHPKLKRLKKRIGLKGPEYLQRLWLQVAISKSTGLLDTWDDNHIATACGLARSRRVPNATALVTELVRERWLDHVTVRNGHAWYANGSALLTESADAERIWFECGDGSHLYVHEWHIHQPWAAASTQRRRDAVKAANAGVKKRRDAARLPDQQQQFFNQLESIQKPAESNNSDTGNTTAIFASIRDRLGKRRPAQ